MEQLRHTGWGRGIYHGLGLVMWLTRRGLPRARLLAGIARQREVRLIHTNIRVGHDREGVLAARLAGLPCLCHIRHPEKLGWFDRRLASTVDRFVYISQAVRQSHRESGVSAEKGRIVYNGLDIAAFEGAMDPAGGRASLGLGADALAVGMVGRLDTWKGHEVFLRAVAKVEEAVPAARGIVVGDPPPDRPGYRGELEMLRDDLQLTNKVMFSPFRMDVPVVMSALDVLVLASTSPEPFGRVLIEAMAAGKPVVAADSGAAREILEDGVQGLLVPPGDVEALASAVTRLLTEPQLAHAMGQRGRKRVGERFGIRQYVEGVQAAYRELLDGVPPSVGRG
jgi:glycosyltransferase involved in cell wall biosynthesis